LELKNLNSKNSTCFYQNLTVLSAIFLLIINNLGLNNSNIRK
jgi:hypothetical protein